MYPPFSDDVAVDEDALVEPIGLPGLIFATNPARPTIASRAPHQNPREIEDDLATAMSLDCPLNLRIIVPVPVLYIYSCISI